MTPSLQPLTALGGEGAYLCYMSRPVGTEREAEAECICVKLNVLVCTHRTRRSHWNVGNALYHVSCCGNMHMRISSTTLT